MNYQIIAIICYKENWLGQSREGSKAKNIFLAAQNYGFDIKVYRFRLDSLREKAKCL